jgi:hypothetical protein
MCLWKVLKSVPQGIDYGVVCVRGSKNYILPVLVEAVLPFSDLQTIRQIKMIYDLHGYGFVFISEYTE